MQKTPILFRKISAGLITSVAVLTAVFVYNRKALPVELFLYETMPFYNYNENGTISKLFAIGKNAAANERIYAAEETKIVFDREEISPFADNLEGVSHIVNVFVADEKEQRSAEINKANEGVSQIEQSENTGDFDIVGTTVITYSDETGEGEINMHEPEAIAPFHAAWLSDLDFVRKSFYSVEKYTDLTAADFDGRRFAEMNLKIKQNGNEPKVLIFHTHMYEAYAGSEQGNLYQGVYGLGEELCRVLGDKYGIAATHHNGRYDLVNGSVDVSGAYERMEPEIQKIIDANPNIEVVIDIHRDGVADNIKLESKINGQAVAPIMFVNGMSKIYDNNTLKPISFLPNPYLSENLAFSFQMQLAANELYPGFARRIYLKPYRYSLNMKPKSLLVEIGAQTNSYAEALRAVEPLADILAKVIIE